MEGDGELGRRPSSKLRVWSCIVVIGSPRATRAWTSDVNSVSIGIDAYDHAAAFTAFDAALAVNPSSALTYVLGSVILGWGGEAERATEKSGRGLRLSPFDLWAWAAFDAQAMSQFAAWVLRSVVRLTDPSRPIRRTASLTCN